MGLEVYQSKWPEVVRIHEKLVKGERFSSLDKQWIKELVEETGWSVEDVMDEIKNLDKDPSTRVGKYQKIFEDCLLKAKELKEKKRNRQAGEKLWGAVIALLKLYASKRGIPLITWDSESLFSLIGCAKEGQTQDAILNLITRAGVLHQNYYECILGKKAFKYFFDDTSELIEKFKEFV